MSAKKDGEDEDDEDEDGGDGVGRVEGVGRVLRGTDLWKHRVSWLELQLMVDQVPSAVHSTVGSFSSFLSSFLFYIIFVVLFIYY